MRSSVWTILAIAIIFGVLMLLMMPAGRTPSRTELVSVSADAESSDGSMTHVERIQSRRTVRAPASPQLGLHDADGTNSPLAHLSPAIKTVFAAAALVICLALAALFLDAGRRGRYAWPLRLGTAIVFAGLCVLLWKIGPLM